ncbi:MAG: dipeptidase [Salinirussus sp.]
MPTDAPIFDFAASEPWEQAVLAYGNLDATNEAIRDIVADGKTKDEAWEAIWDYEARRFETDPDHREAVRDLYRRAGVDVMSATPWTHDKTLEDRVGQRRALARWQTRFDAADWMRKITTPAEARTVAADDAVGILLNTQNLGGAIGGRVEDVETLYNEGLRVFQLTYNYQNLLASGCGDPSEGGLSALGREAVDSITDLGGIVDLSHCGTQTTLDTIEYAEAPVAVTHAGCRAIRDHYRGKTDEEIRKLADNDGYMGIVGLPWFLAEPGSEPGLDVLCDHIEHAASIIGIENVGIGTDFFPCDTMFPSELVEYYKRHIISLGFDPAQVKQREGLAGGLGAFETWADWPAIIDAIHDRFDDEAARGILGENFVDFWERSIAA